MRIRPADWIVTAAVAALAQAEVWTTADLEPKSLHAAAALAMSLPLLVRRRWPEGVLVAVFVPLYAMRLAGESVDGGFVMAVLIVAFTAVGFHRERRAAAIGFAIGLGLLALLLALEVAADEDASGAGDFVFLAAILGSAWLLAVLLRERTHDVERQAERAQRADDRARTAVADERARIARELHDVVAHSISVIAVQTGSLRHRLRHERPDDARELAALEDVARQALADMRRMLGLLRATDGGAELDPQPGIGQIDALLAQVRAAGLGVDLDITGRPRQLTPGLDLAAYRIVQEALTNILKHAGGAPARVTVHYGERELGLGIEDEGRTSPNGTPLGEGHGIVGMRERVNLYGGSLRAEPREGGGFAVRAVLPLEAP